jgi:hypothetical protein
MALLGGFSYFLHGVQFGDYGTAITIKMILNGQSARGFVRSFKGQCIKARYDVRSTVYSHRP